jgi:HK97 family phage major capsid protein
VNPEQTAKRRTELEAERKVLLEEAQTLTRDDLEGDDLTRFEDIEKRVGEIDAEETKLDRYDKIHASLAAGAGQRVSLVNPPMSGTRKTDPFQTPDGPESATETRSRALAAVEQWKADDELKESATRTLEHAGAGSPDGAADVRGVAGHILRYSHPLYISAFRKYAADPEGGYLADLTPEENRVWREAREYQRAALATSGAVLPSPLDPTIVLTNVGAVDPLRQIVRVDSTTSKTKRYITSAGSTFSFDAELAEVSDDTHTEAEVEITNHKAQGFIQASIETFMDQPNFSSEVAKIIADGKMRLESEKFITGAGDGSDEPFGLETRLAGSASVVNPATAEVFESEDVYSVIEALPPRWRSRASWLAELSTINQIDQMETANGSKQFPRVGDAEPVLLRRRLYEGSDVDAFSDVNPAATADNHILYAGDFQNYVILDRVGLSVHFIAPGVLQNTANGLPDGRVGWYAYWRVGADRLTIDAFRVLNLATSV